MQTSRFILNFKIFLYNYKNSTKVNYMKNILTLLTLLIISIIITSCSKTPFKAQEPKEKEALVYIYVASPNGINVSNRNPSYKISINDKNIDEYLGEEEYIALDLKPKFTKISAIRADIEKQSLELNLKSGKSYYIRVRSFSDDFAKFDIESIKEDIALKEISITLNAKIKKTQEDKTEIQKVSKLQEIEKAHELKEKGILSDEEFNVLKKEILAK